ncbi:ThiF family adenylyltransferase, partial [Staphylococcus epidermidis]|uniref:ThiF family adenylyltransferase n=1 Tax=Staphylococcus epidermidis TaxID=1282 RepID=UPI0016432485
MWGYERERGFGGFGEEGEEKVWWCEIVIFGGGGLGRDIVDELGGMGGDDIAMVDMDIVEI